MKGFRKLLDAQQAMTPASFLVAQDIASGGIKRYYVCNSLDDFIAHNGEHRPHFYEVINGRQRLYFDIDIRTSVPELQEVDNPKKVCDDFVHALFLHLKEYLRRSQSPHSTSDPVNDGQENDTESEAKINVYVSHTPERFSYHLVVQNRYAQDERDCYRQILHLLAPFEHTLKKYIDMSLYKRSQLFRMVGSCKIDNTNFKMYWKGSKEFKDSLICHYLPDP